MELTTTPIIDVYRSKALEVPEVRSLLPFADIERALMRRRLQAKQESGAIEAVCASGTIGLHNSMYVTSFCNISYYINCE